MAEPSLPRLRGSLSKEKQIVGELNSLFNHLNKAQTSDEKNLILSQIGSLKDSLGQVNEAFLNVLEETGVARPLNPRATSGQVQTIQPSPMQIQQPVIKKGKRKKRWFGFTKRKDGFSELEAETLKRLGKKERKVQKRKVDRRPSRYIKISNRFFSNYSRDLLKKGKFKKIERSIIKAKLRFIPSSYISVLLFTTVLSAIAAIFIFLFLLIFKLSIEFPIISLVSGGFGIRLLKTFWILFVIPLGTFLFMYFYPSLEEKSAEAKINVELPFATIHMAAISGSMIDPSKIFSILVSTHEYPHLEKEFTRLINEVNIYGYDLITALKNISFNSPSKKLSEMLNGLATTISSGGSLPDFFKRRAESLLFEYKLNREKRTKTSETFMDIYISVVIAAPMILMLLLIMMKISGLGITLSTSTITLITVLGVFLINILFLTFLYIKQPSE